MKNKFLGNFEVSSGALRVTDPCYDMDARGAGTLENVVNGIWDAHIDEDVNRSFVLYICLSSNSNSTLNIDELANFDVDVDSGQAGFYDLEYFKNNHGGEYDDLNSFYGQCCSVTYSPDDKEQIAGVHSFGVTSSSGFGDGSYRCFVERNENEQIIAAKIVFVSYDEEYDEEYD